MLPGNEMKRERGQVLPLVLIVGAVLAVIAYSLLFLFQNETKLMVRHMDLDRKTELATVALEHARYKLQSGNMWYNVPMGGFKYDVEYTVPGLGNYTVDIVAGNLFLLGTGREDSDETRTIGIKVKVYPSKDTHIYYAVVKKVGYGGAIVSKGYINLPCTDAAISGQKYNFFWGDVISANPSDDAIRIPNVPTVIGTGSPAPWGPAVYARGAIYTALGKSGSTHSFGYTYDDMSPTAKCHPYSSYAAAPAVSIDGYKQMAKENGSYYGPATIGGTGAANPFYINDGNHDLADLSAIGVAQRLSRTSHVVFIDTTDGLPMRVPASPSTPTNTYCGTTYVSSGTLAMYYNNCTQVYTVGSLIVNGPVVFKGDDPGPDPSISQKTDPLGDFRPAVVGIKPPGNYYFPQGSFDKYEYSTSANQCALLDIKHAGFIYVTGEMRIGGPRCNTAGTCMLPPAPKEKSVMEAVRDNMRERAMAAARAIDSALVAPAYAVPKTDTPTKTPTPGGPTNTPTPVVTDTPVPTPTTPPVNCSGSISNSAVIFYGTIYLEDTASLTVDTVNDDPKFYVYYNERTNAFAYLQNNVIVTSFKEHTFLVPTPAPAYPF